MSEEVLWDELMRLSQGWIDTDEKPGFRDTYRLVARVLSTCHRLGVEHPGTDLLGRDSFTDAELEDFFNKTWRLATLHAEQRRTNIIEARRGVDRDSRDFHALRETMAEARQMILEFKWLPDERKRRHLDELEALLSGLQRSRDDFDVALANVDDPYLAATIEIGRPSGWGAFVQKVFGVLGPTRVDDKALPAPERALPRPHNE
jgi:hypothetical protein